MAKQEIDPTRVQNQEKIDFKKDAENLYNSLLSPTIATIDYVIVKSKEKKIQKPLSVSFLEKIFFLPSEKQFEEHREHIETKQFTIITHIDDFKKNGTSTRILKKLFSDSTTKELTIGVERHNQLLSTSTSSFKGDVIFVSNMDSPQQVIVFDSYGYPRVRIFQARKESSLKDEKVFNLHKKDGLEKQDAYAILKTVKLLVERENERIKKEKEKLIKQNVS